MKVLWKELAIDSRKPADEDDSFDFTMTEMVVGITASLKSHTEACSGVFVSVPPKSALPVSTAAKMDLYRYI